MEAQVSRKVSSFTLQVAMTDRGVPSVGLRRVKYLLIRFVQKLIYLFT